MQPEEEVIRSAFQILTGKPAKMRPLGKPSRRWENIRMDLKVIGVKMSNWVDSALDKDYLESPCECGTKAPVSIR